jgi:tetratricopeptide (TPR) repeat protein
MTYDFSISPKDFDVSLLPPNVRTVGSDEFGEAVHAYLTKEFEGFGGTERIVVSNEVIHVTWNPDLDNPDPLRPALEKLRRGQLPQAIQLLELLRSQSPNDHDILLNLGMALLKTGRTADGEEVLRRVVTISPSNQDAWFGLAEATFLQDRPEDADDLYRKAIEIGANSEIAELARGRLSEIAQKIFRSKMPDVERTDAVMYLVGAIDKFEGMPRQVLQKIGVEIAMLGAEGFDVNDSSEKYQLRSLPGRISGLHTVCLMYAAFTIINPTADIGFDLANEYASAQQMKRDQRNT